MTTSLIVPIVNYLPQLLIGLVSAGAALGGVLLTQHRIDKRERAAAAKKADEERLFISTELVFVLEKFVEECAEIVLDDGEERTDGVIFPTTDTPVERSALAGRASRLCRSDGVHALSSVLYSAACIFRVPQSCSSPSMTPGTCSSSGSATTSLPGPASVSSTCSPAVGALRSAGVR